ncbi:hypothetical protein ANANG_G00299010 [Anguilla anguilla]|uniref:Uncharacterized protein n=1 Tax=Anguilla anguilla TaxID=7936 RepID=A0A9D3LQQ4_ANGAN|nr:hypothetical protein ANANG_G00299010 [Anguilla anguilla]
MTIQTKRRRVMVVVSTCHPQNVSYQVCAKVWELRRAGGSPRSAPGLGEEASWFTEQHKEEVCQMIRDAVDQRVRHFLETRHQRGQPKQRKGSASASPVCIKGERIRLAAYFMKRHVNLRCVGPRRRGELRVFPERLVVCASVPADAAEGGGGGGGGGEEADPTAMEHSKSEYFAGHHETQDPLNSSAITKRITLQKIAKKASAQAHPCPRVPGGRDQQGAPPLPLPWKLKQGAERRTRSSGTGRRRARWGERAEGAEPKPPQGLHGRRGRPSGTGPRARGLGRPRGRAAGPRRGAGRAAAGRTWRGPGGKGRAAGRGRASQKNVLWTGSSVPQPGHNKNTLCRVLIAARYIASAGCQIATLSGARPGTRSGTGAYAAETELQTPPPAKWAAGDPGRSGRERRGRVQPAQRDKALGRRAGGGEPAQEVKAKAH